MDGLAKALATDADAIGQMDADLSHDPAYLPDLVAGLDQHNLVIGSRYLHGVSVINWPLHRIVLSAFANRYIRFVTGLGPQDCTSGFRVWRRDALARLPFQKARANGYAFLTEMLYEAARHGCRKRRTSNRVRRTPGRLLEGVAEGAVGIADDPMAAHCARRPADRQTMNHRHVVVMVTTSPFPGDGVGSFIEPIARSVAERGHDVHLVAPSHRDSHARLTSMASPSTSTATRRSRR